MITDNGGRTEFPSGAVRDIKKGNGRFDVMPLSQMAEIMNDPLIRDIGIYFEEGNVDALRNAILTAADIIYNGKSIAYMMLDVAKHFEEGCEKYGEGNWKKGIPTKSFVDSAVRHYMKWLDGWDDESHNRAIIWNLLCCLWTEENAERLKKEEK